MNDADLEAARFRAYQIWERDGRPHGADESHWHQALKELGLIEPIDEDRAGIAAQARRWEDEEESRET